MSYSNTVALVQPATGPSRVCEGSNVTLHCVIVFNSGNTTIVQATVWRRNGTIIDVINLPNHSFLFNSTTGGVTGLLITNVSLDDDNVVYSCTATGANNIASSLMLNVTGMYVHTHVVQSYPILYAYVIYMHVIIIMIMVYTYLCT